MNYKIIIEYDGTRYKGWQVQNSTDLTIQGQFQDILKKFAGEFVEVIGSGRTDAGVHAKGQVANFHLPDSATKRYAVSGGDEKTEALARILAAKKAGSSKGADYKTAEKYSPKDIMDYLNRHLTDDVAVISIEKVDERFHSRYNAVSKWYRYRIHTSRQSNVFERKYVYPYTTQPLDVKKMQQAAAHMVGRMDFKSFCGNNKMKKSTVRTVTAVDVRREGNEIVIDYKGDGFLQNMIRIMTGTLIEVGYGSRDADSIPDLIKAQDRSLAGFTAPPNGLCLMQVDY